MHVDVYERAWMWASGLLIAVFLIAIVGTTAQQAIAPPSHLETIDPTTLTNDAEFGTPTMRPGPNGGVIVPVVTQLFSFNPDPIEVPAHVPVTFRVTSADVIHGFEIVGTNANTMAIPGYVSQFTVTFDKPGEYAVACNEYCGVLHHNMVGKLVVK